jgi:TusA-related sulfurtransferase
MQRNKMANCPSSVTGAKTEIKDTDKGVDILVTSTDKAATDEIRTRGKKIPDHAAGEGKNPAHSGKGGGGGSMGRCPLVQNDTTITYAEVEGGAKFTVEPKDEKERDWLRREAKERLAEMGDSRGDRKMANCPSTVEGAKTTVKEAAGAVVVTVVAKDEAGTKAVRERAKKLSEGKHDGKDKHDGAGSGPMAGRCPAAVEGTKSAVKEVEGGAEITLTPEKKEDLKKVLEEAQDRAKPYE